MLRRLSVMQLYALLVGVVVVAVGVFLVATGVFDLDGDDTDNNNLPAETAVDVAADVDADTVTAAGPPTLTVALEEPFQFGDLLITVTRLRLSNSVSEGRDELIAVARFASVNLRVQNAGAAPLSLAGALQLVDGLGRVYTPNSAASAAVAVRDDSRADALVVSLQPGIEVDLIVVFDLPDDAEDLRLRIRAGFLDVVLDR